MSNIYLLFGKDNFGVIEISKFIVKHSPHLCGTIEISGSKNSALPVMAACIMTGSEVCLKNVPDISDIADMESLLKFLGCKCSFCGGVMCIDSSCVKSVPTPYNEVLFLHYVNELPVKKTAALLERKVSTVKMQLVRGKKLLLQALRGQENE